MTSFPFGEAVDRAWDDAHAGMGPVLVVDDPDLVRSAVRVLLEAEGYGVCEAASGAGGLEMARAWHPSLILLDLDLLDVDGLASPAPGLARGGRRSLQRLLAAYPWLADDPPLGARLAALGAMSAPLRRVS